MFCKIVDYSKMSSIHQGYLSKCGNKTKIPKLSTPNTDTFNKCKYAYRMYEACDQMENHAHIRSFSSDSWEDDMLLEKVSC